MSTLARQRWWLTLGVGFLTLLYATGWQTQARADHEPQNPRVVTDAEIAAAVFTVGPALQGLDALPLSQAKPGGTLTWAWSTDPLSGLITAWTGLSSDIAWFFDHVADRLIEDGFAGVPDAALAEAFEQSPDGRQVSFVLRRGVHWSDGTPFSPDDVIFSFRAALTCVLANDENGAPSLRSFFVSVDQSITSDGRCTGMPALLHNTSLIGPGPNAQLDTVPAGDDVVLGQRILPEPAPLALGNPGDNILSGARLDTLPTGDDVLIQLDGRQLALVWDRQPARNPANLLRAYSLCCMPAHLLDEYAEEALLSNDPQIFLDRWSLDEIRTNPAGYVGTGPFKVDAFIPGPGGGMRLVRNPFYWKVDEEGNQLPKLDELRLIRATDAQAEFQAFIDGQTDDYGPQGSDLALLQSVAEQRNMRLFIGSGFNTSGSIALVFNPDVGVLDPAKEALGIAFRNPEVRRAFSQGIDRQRLVDEVFQGLNTARYAGHHPFDRDIESLACPAAFADPSLAAFCEAFQAIKPNVAYNPDAGRRKLDEIGLIDRNGDGVRDIPAGFGFILPGSNGILDTAPQGDDFVHAGLLVSGLGLSDRDGDGQLDPDPGVIQPGANGVLDSARAEDDVALTTGKAGSFSFTLSGLGLAGDVIFIDGIRQLGIALSGIAKPFPQLVQDLIEREHELVIMAYAGRPLIRMFERELEGCCDANSSMLWEPYVVRMAEIDDLAATASDEASFTRLFAELQLLQAANVSRIFAVGGVGLGGGTPLGAVRVDRVNAPAVPLFSGIPQYTEYLFRLDLQ